MCAFSSVGSQLAHSFYFCLLMSSLEDLEDELDEIAYSQGSNSADIVTLVQESESVMEQMKVRW